MDGRPNRIHIMERKEVMLWADQLWALRDLEFKLRRRRRTLDGVGEPITVNTLIRVAVDLLLAEADRLDPASENSLLSSVGLPTRGDDGEPLRERR